MASGFGGGGGDDGRNNNNAAVIISAVPFDQVLRSNVDRGHCVIEVKYMKLAGNKTVYFFFPLLLFLLSFFLLLLLLLLLSIVLGLVDRYTCARTYSYMLRSIYLCLRGREKRPK